jgi:hypothetical protein
MPTILHERLPEAKKVLEKLARKARKYGCPDIRVEVGQPYEQVREILDFDGESRKVRTTVVDVNVTGDAPKVGNFEFLARLDPNPTGTGNIVMTRPGVEDLDQKFWTAPCGCQHCNIKRYRRNTFVVKNVDTGEQLQIGRNCLTDYLGQSPEAAIARFKCYYEASNSGGDYGGWIDPTYSLHGSLKVASAAIRLFGWCSKGAAMKDESLTPTVHYLYTVFEDPTKLGRSELATREKLLAAMKDGDQDEKMAEAVIKWVRDELKPKSDYEHNLKTMLAVDVVPVKYSGFVASAVAAYSRAKEKELRYSKQRADDAKSDHMGQVGDRLKKMSVVQTMCKVVGGDSQWGEMVLVKFRTDDGNILTWFTGKGTGLQNGEKAVIDGTVKRHNDYNGVKETQLSRVRIR